VTFGGWVQLFNHGTRRRLQTFEEPIKTTIGADGYVVWKLIVLFKSSCDAYCDAWFFATIHAPWLAVFNR